MIVSTHTVPATRVQGKVQALSPSDAGNPLTGIMGEMGATQGNQIAYIGGIAPRVASYATPSPALPAALQTALARLEIEQLYSHQVEALRLARDGQDLVVVTATSSGKTLCYNLPVIESILGNRDTRALYIYPINALVNDQAATLERLAGQLPPHAVSHELYVGSVSRDKRQQIRSRQPNIMLTNPEMVHLSFLQWHHLWASMWKNLTYVVLDEVHTYRGVFGAHMAGLIRRLLRVAHYYGASPQFICCSATIANPAELVETLTSRPCQVVDQDGSASGRRLFVLWNPPVVKEEGENVRRSYASESVDLLRLCLQAGLNTIVFTRARRLTEQMLRMSQESKGEALPQIASYRAGYLADEREAIEGQLKAGELRGVITTNALELGIDIGGLDSAIIAGYPGSIMSTWQQAGRAGRGSRDALVFLVASQNPLDQFYMAHPERFFDEPHEQAVIDLANPFVRLKHLLCSTREIPWTPLEQSQQPADIQADLAALQSKGLLEEQRRSGLSFLAYPDEATRRPLHMRVSLRAAGQDTYRILDESNHEVGTIQPPNAFRETHPGAIYQHSDGDYRVVALNTREHTVRVVPESLPHYTRSQSASSLSVTQTLIERPLGSGQGGATVALGEVLVTEVVSGYQELKQSGNAMVRRVDLDAPLRVRLHTTALWVTLPVDLQDRMPGDSPFAQREVLEQGLHAVQHLMVGLVPLLIMCDRRDIGGESAVNHPDLTRSALFLYDAYEGGMGLAQAAYERVEQLLSLAYDTIRLCTCTDGCPACIQSSTCTRGNEGLDKQAATHILRELAPLYHASSDTAFVSHRRQVAGSLGRSLERALGEIDEATRVYGLRERAELSPATPEPAAPEYAVGMWVHHAVYGRGIVIEAEGTGNGAWVTVRYSRRNLIQRISVKSPQLRKVT